jgi:hypothetical protein
MFLTLKSQKNGSPVIRSIGKLMDDYNITIIYTQSVSSFAQTGAKLGLRSERPEDAERKRRASEGSTGFGSMKTFVS